MSISSNQNFKLFEIDLFLWKRLIRTSAQPEATWSMPQAGKLLQLEGTRQEVGEEEDTPPMDVEEVIILGAEVAGAEEVADVDLFENFFPDTE
mmetsp:Transcript_8922/g.22052  ORF Transcript_8922/g.22052 Transcript_8922/m.22052 type:complete len:93 (+) Transcript_8922:4384-4662(+)